MRKCAAAFVGGPAHTARKENHHANPIHATVAELLQRSCGVA